MSEDELLSMRSPKDLCGWLEDMFTPNITHRQGLVGTFYLTEVNADESCKTQLQKILMEVNYITPINFHIVIILS